MKYDIYVCIRDTQELIDRKEASSEKGLLDIISLYFLDENMEISRKSPKCGEHDVYLKIYPHLERYDLVLNKYTMQLRRVDYVDMDRVKIFNTDDKHKAELQRGGYILSKNGEWDRDDIIPISYDNLHCEIYYPGSSIGKDKDFNKMEDDGMSSYLDFE